MERSGTCKWRNSVDSEQGFATYKIPVRHPHKIAVPFKKRLNPTGSLANSHGLTATANASVKKPPLLTVNHLGNRSVYRRPFPYAFLQVETNEKRESNHYALNDVQNNRQTSLPEDIDSQLGYNNCKSIEEGNCSSTRSYVF